MKNSVFIEVLAFVVSVIKRIKIYIVKSNFYRLCRLFFWSFLCALIIRTFCFEPFNIPSESMKPTLLVGDYLFVSKYSYGYSGYSLPFFSFSTGSGRLFYTQPDRGDVLVFKLPSDPSKNYIKRLIGLPGDEIQIINDLIYINGKKVRRERIENVSLKDRTTQKYYKAAQYLEYLPGGNIHRIYQSMDPKRQSVNTNIFVVPKDHFFMMGDNRDNSYDSRFFSEEFRYIPKANLVGKALFFFFSKDPNISLFNMPSYRWNRFFKGIY